MTKNHMADSLREFWLTWCPMKTVNPPDSVPNMVYFLASDQGSFINGEIINVGGGLTYAP